MVRAGVISGYLGIPKMELMSGSRSRFVFVGLLPVESKELRRFSEEGESPNGVTCGITGDQLLSEFFGSRFREVVACWQWSNFVESQQDSARRVVYVNMDETMIRLWQGGLGELVKFESFADRKWFLNKEERVSLAERRQNSSMIAFISDCPRAQAFLPLFMLLNENHTTKNAAQPIVNEFAGNRNVVFLRRKSSWNSVELMVWMLGDLRRRLEPLGPLAQVVLLLDCAPAMRISV